jgi:hypothetical protein
MFSVVRVGGCARASRICPKPLYEQRHKPWTHPKKERAIVGPYLEFAERLPLPQHAALPASQLTEAHRREGFEASSADKIFARCGGGCLVVGVLWGLLGFWGLGFGLRVCGVCARASSLLYTHAFPLAAFPHTHPNQTRTARRWRAVASTQRQAARADQGGRARAFLFVAPFVFFLFATPSAEESDVRAK